MFFSENESDPAKLKNYGFSERLDFVYVVGSAASGSFLSRVENIGSMFDAPRPDRVREILLLTDPGPSWFRRWRKSILADTGFRTVRLRRAISRNSTSNRAPAEKQDGASAYSPDDSSSDETNSSSPDETNARGVARGSAC